MKECYGSAETGTTIYTMPAQTDDRVLVTGVQVNRKFRGRGYASAALRELCADADVEGLTLILSVEPDGTGLNYEQLRAWYRRNGFEPLHYQYERDSSFMRRLPKREGADPGIAQA